MSFKPPSRPPTPNHGHPFTHSPIAPASGTSSHAGPSGSGNGGSSRPGTASGSLTPAKRSLAMANHAHGTGGPIRKGSVDSDNGKKKRISLSCAQCAKRKQKCNREFPCNHCIARKVPELCVPYNPASNNSSTNGPDPGTSHRLERLETVLSYVVRHHGGLWGYKDIKEWMHDEPFSRLFPSTPTGTPKPITDSDRDFKDRDKDKDRKPTLPLSMGTPDFELDGDNTGDELEKLGQMEGMPESMEARGKVNIKHDIHGTPAENLQQLIRDCGVSPHKLAELVHELPPKHFADRIIDWFFSRLNFARYPLDERHFRTSYEGLYNRSMAVDPADVRALPMIFIVLALAVRLAPEEWAGDDQTRRLSSLRMYWSSRRSILIATAIQSESLELVISRLLSAMYLVTIHDRRLTECWSQLGASLRTAQAIGLHRDGSKLGLDPHQTEYRRRIWSYLYHADKVYSLVLGRPPSISDSYTDTLPPSNLDLSAFYTAPGTPPPIPLPLSQPTTATFLILRRNLSTLVGKVVHHFQKLDEAASYRDVEGLQVELDQFTDALPPHFRMYEPDKSLDDNLFWLPVHRFSLISEIIMTTIILHRPWLLRKLSTNRYAASRTACFEMAKLDFQLRQEHHRSVPDYKVFQSQGQFKMFNSAMIAGISAIIDPRGPDGDAMRKILGAFLEMNPWSEVKAKDETTRKEVQIIQTLSRRAGQIYENSFAPGELAAQDRDSVSLLLGLRGDAAPDASTVGPLTQPGAGLPGDTTMRPGAAHAHSHGAKGWASLINNQPIGLHTQSPGSSVHEDDSQRMLDHWLNANTSLAVGTINGALPPLDPTGLGYLPMPAISMSNLGPVPGPYVPPTPLAATPGGGAGVMTPGGMGHGHGSGQGQAGQTPMGMMPWDTPSQSGGMMHSPVIHAPPPPQANPTLTGPMGGDMTYAGGFNEGIHIQQPQPQPHPQSHPPHHQQQMMMASHGHINVNGAGMMGMDMPMQGNNAMMSMPGAGLLEGENSDDYWNALIDGILGTTGNTQVPPSNV